MTIFSRFQNYLVRHHVPRHQIYRYKSRRSNKRKQELADGMPGLIGSYGQRFFSEGRNFFSGRMLMKMKEIWPLLACMCVKVTLLGVTVARSLYTRDDVRWFPGGTFVCERTDDLLNDVPPTYRKLINLNQKVEWPCGLKEAVCALDPCSPTDPAKLPKKQPQKKKDEKPAKPKCQ